MEEYPVTVNKHRESIYKKKLTGDEYSPLDDSVDLSYNLVDDSSEDRATYWICGSITFQYFILFLYLNKVKTQ